MKHYYDIDPEEPEVNYYLAALYALRSDYPHAWHHLRQSEKIVHQKGHYPKSLIEFRRELQLKCPE